MPGDQRVRLYAGQPACEPCRGGPVDVSSAGRPGGRFWPWARWGVGVLDLGYRQVDVFSRRALQGNGLAVVLRRVEVRTRGADRWVDATMDQGVPRLGPAIAGELAQAYRDALSLAHGQLHPALPMQVVST